MDDGKCLGPFVHNNESRADRAEGTHPDVPAACGEQLLMKNCGAAYSD